MAGQPKLARPVRAALIASIALIAAPAPADDLRDALAMAYNTNPTLQSARNLQTNSVQDQMNLAPAYKASSRSKAA